MYSAIIILRVMMWQSRRVLPQKFLEGLWSKKEDFILLELKQSKQGYTHPIFHYIKAINVWPRFLRKLSQGRGSHEDREDQRMLEFLKHWPENFYQCPEMGIMDSVWQKETHCRYTFPFLG